MERTVSFYRIFLALVGSQICALPALASGTEEATTVLNWPGQIWQRLKSERNQLGLQVTNILFNETESFNILSLPVSSGGKFSVRTGRVVYDNYDQLQTFTVIDRLSVYTRYAKSLAEVATTTGGVGKLNASLYVGGEQGFEMGHVRQVPALLGKTVPRLEELQSAPLEWAPLSTASPWYYVDPSVRPHFSSVLSRLTFPVKVPLSLTGLNKLENGEMFSYSARGGVFLGANVGWDLDYFEKINTLDVRLYGEVFLSGEFSVSILKESNRYVKVKLSHVGALGVRGGLTQSIVKEDIYDGLLIYGDTRVGATDLKIVPFLFSRSDETQRFSDRIYRFDLALPETRDAYEKAVLGRFTDADHLIGRVGVDGKPQVEILMERKGNREQSNQRIQFQIAPFGKREKTRFTERMTAEVWLPNGISTIEKLSIQFSKTWRTFLGVFEKRRGGFTIAYDHDTYGQGDPLSYGLVAEMQIEDARTNGKEILNYMALTRAVTGLKGFFPDLQTYLPSSALQGMEDSGKELESSRKFRWALFGRSSFYFGFNLTRPQVEKWIGLSPSERKLVTELAFVHAGLLQGRSRARDGAKAAFLSRWNKLAKETDPSERLTRFKRLLKKRTFHLEAMLAFRYGLSEESLDTFVTAQSSAFGQLQDRSETRANVDKILVLADQEAGFERQAGGFRGDPESVVSDLTVNVIGPRELELVFSLEGTPKLLNLRITRNTGLRRLLILQDLILLNRDGRFKAGLNRLVIDPMSPDPLSRQLFEGMEAGEFYQVNLGYSLDGSRWGQAASTRFELPAPIEIEE